MQYFKHYCNARRSESLTSLIKELGFAGYGRYWALLEYLGADFDGETTVFRIPCETIRELLRFRSVSDAGLFLERLATYPGKVPDLSRKGPGLIANRYENVFEINAPILLDLLDRDFKRARRVRAETASRIDIEEDKDIEKEIEPPANLRDLNYLFAGKIGEQTYKRISPQTKQVWLELYGSDLNFIARSFISAFAKWSSRLPKDQGVPDTFFTTQLQYDWPHHVRHKSKNQKPEPSGGLLTDWADEKEA